MRKLGLIGGLGPRATTHYYEELVKAGAGELLIVHADLSRVLRDVEGGDRLGLAQYLSGLIDRLAAGGAEFAAISAVAPHCCIHELEGMSVIPVVNIVDEVSAEIRARRYKRVALFGTRFVMESRLFGMLEDVEVIVPPEIDTVHEIYIQIVNGCSEGKSTLSRIAEQLPVDAVVLAGTDLSIVFDEANTDFPHIDCARVHVRAIARQIRRPV